MKKIPKPQYHYRETLCSSALETPVKVPSYLTKQC